MAGIFILKFDHSLPPRSPEPGNTTSADQSRGSRESSNTSCEQQSNLIEGNALQDSSLRATGPAASHQTHLIVDSDFERLTMAPRKGLSFDEKRARLSDIFTETADFFTLKELEKIAPKRKGIVSQSVKEVLQSLVDDDLVNTDKCGVQTVFWALPSEVSQKRKAKMKQVSADLKNLKAEEKGLKLKTEEMAKGREKSEERTKILENIKGLEKLVKSVDEELARFAEFDPDEIEKLKSNTEKVRSSVNRWVDNLFNCQSWAQKKFNMDKKDFDKQFGIPSELDYLEK